MLCKQENILMRKYGLEFKDFKDDEWRDMFDSYAHISVELAKTYISPVKLAEFHRDLETLKNKKTKVYEQFELLCKTAGIDAESEQHGAIYDILMET